MHRATCLIYISLYEINIFLNLSLMMLSSIKLVVIVYVKTLIMFNTIIRTGPRTTHVVRAGDLVPEGGTMLVTPGLDVQTRLEANLEGCEMVINALP